TVGFGSRFWFELPLREAINPTVERRALPGKLAGLDVLIVDDVLMNRRILARQLAGFGIESMSVEDGFAAMAELERAFHQGKPFDLVIIDQMMPGLSGEALAQRIRATAGLAETKIVIASSAGRHGLAEGTSSIIDAVLTKPVREQSLLDAFAQLFGFARMRRTEPSARRCRLRHRRDGLCESCSQKTTRSTSSWSRCCFARRSTRSMSSRMGNWRWRPCATRITMSC